eukprot:1137560-Pelagomonas_calceolata.AAC.6
MGSVYADISLHDTVVAPGQQGCSVQGSESSPPGVTPAAAVTTNTSIMAIGSFGGVAAVVWGKRISSMLPRAGYALSTREMPAGTCRASRSPGDGKNEEFYRRTAINLGKGKAASRERQKEPQDAKIDPSLGHAESLLQLQILVS